MAYELLVLDVDGTLVNTKKEITERTKEALWECQDQGIKVAIASGRCTEGIRHQAKAIGLDQFGGYVISFNGGRITNFATGEVIYDITLPDGMIHELYDYSKKEHTGILTYDAGKIVAHSDTDPYITIDAKGCDNDLPMIEYAGFGVAMANAPEQLKEKADYVAPSCDEDGLVDVITRFIKDW